MKKSVLIMCLATAISVTGVSIAQTKQDRERITQGYNLVESKIIAQDINSYSKENYKRAVRLARKYAWPLKVKYKDGGIGELVGVLEGDFPLYYRTYNKGSISTIHADAVHTGGRAGLDLNGEDMIAGVWDGGSVRITHELFEDRVVKKDTSDYHSHSTHVAGTINGSANVENGEAIGVAPLAVVFSYDWNNDFEKMISEAKEGLLVSNHSYGIAATDENGELAFPVSFFGQYNYWAQYLDNILYTHDYYLPVTSAGNDRQKDSVLNPAKHGFDLLTGMTVAKNNLVVGSIKEVTEYRGPSNVDLSPFSNYGPTDDGRVKPDITAKGSNVYSAIAETDSSYKIMSGTSMAAPSVTGGI